MRVDKILVLSVLIVLLSSNVDSSGCTKYKKSFASALSRKKRIIFFPPLSSILITPSLIKGIIAMYPRGYATSFEIDIYHTLPGSFEDYGIKYFQDKKTTPKPPKMMPVMHMAPEHPIILNHDPYPEDHHFHDHFHNDSAAPSNGKRIDDFSNVRGMSKYWPMENRRTGDYSSYSPNNFWGRHPLGKQITPLRSQYNTQRDYYGTNFVSSPTHRDRRSIYSSLEKAGDLVGFNVRSCILRTICEVKHYLLPPGKSMIQDIVRVLFTIPDTLESYDEYSIGGKVSGSKDCKTIYSKRCPISVLSLLMHKEIL